MNPQFPLYIPSKGRYETRQTAAALNAANIPYHIVVEEQEYSDYKAVIEGGKVLVLDDQFKRDYETCDQLGDSVSYGAGPARNFAWAHSIANGFSHHWVMDDNITYFMRLNKNLKVPVGDGTIFRAMEDFCLRYTNVAMAGPNYAMFVPRKNKVHPFVINTRIYSCNFIRNSLPFRWRARLNEDTDLSLRILKAGLCTIQFNAFLQNKLPTQTVKGGNMDEFYAKEGTYDKSKILIDLHPDCARMMWRFGRWHHYVDYSGFKKQKLIRKADADIPQGINNYGMKYKTKGKKGVTSDDD